MNKLAIRLMTLALCSTALALVPIVTPAKAETNGSGHIKKHKKHWRPRFSDPWSVGQVPPFAGPSSPAAPVCPGLGRSFDCKVWPPPYDEDPDRKIPKF